MFTRFFRIQSRFAIQFNLISQIILLYSELELALLNCVQIGRGGDLDGVFKPMFRTRIGVRRVDTASDLGRAAYAAMGLDSQFATAIIWMQHCREIRNQYAHAYWHDDETGWLCFVGLEELAQSEAEVRDFSSLAFYHLDETLLREQELFFRYTESALAWLNYKIRLLRGEVAINPNPEIDRNLVTLPPLHLPWPPPATQFGLQQ